MDLRKEKYKELISKLIRLKDYVKWKEVRNTSSADSDNIGLDEWKEARSIFVRFDNNLHDLRKYGFSFITALLAANGLLSQTLPGTKVTTNGGVTTTEVTSVTTLIPDMVKVGMLVATLGLIVALRLLDTHYLDFEKAASIRARILENRLNQDITWDICHLYDLEQWWKNVQRLYYGFVVLTTVLGYFILGLTIPFGLLFVAAFVSFMLVYQFNRKKTWPGDDWCVDRKIVSAGDSVRITYTNLHHEPGITTLSWSCSKLVPPPKPAEVKEAKASQPTEVGKDGATLYENKYFDSYDWLWNTKDVNPGLYKLVLTSTRTSTVPRSVTMTIQVNPKAQPDSIKLAGIYFGENI